MKFRPEILLFVLAPVLLIAALSCIHGGGSGDCEKKFGGPYPFGGLGITAMNDKEEGEKFAAFALSRGLQLNVSTVSILKDITSFAESIKANRTTPNDEQQQKYNYVIMENCDILVAVWNADADAKLAQIVAGVACAGGGADGGMNFPQPKPGNMINWAPEEPYGSALAINPAKHSPCWLDAARKREKGVLDAISKHFMLAQGEGITIDDYKEKKWAKAKVTYAGEILVDLTTTPCTYIVTENSGTYKAKGEFRRAVNEFFATEVNKQTGTLTLPNPVPNC